MATVQSMNLARLLALEADTVIGGHIDSSSHLILEQHDGSTIDAGQFTVDATTAIKGIAELATDAEAIAGTDTGRVITPSNLTAVAGTFVPQASTTVQGKVELATDAEATTGTDAVRAVTPANLAAVAGTFVPQSTTAVQGKVELATTAEATTGTDTVRAVTPAGLKAAIDAVLQLIYPIGSYYISDSVGTNPNTLLGFGTWSAVQGNVLIGDDGSTFIHANTGGAQTHTLATGNLPAHNHAAGTLAVDSQGAHTHSVQRDFDAGSGSVRWSFHTSGGAGGGANTTDSQGGHTHTVSGSSANTGSGTAVNHMPPWRAVYMWRRTA
jgi:microcystin-dependent protein